MFKSFTTRKFLKNLSKYSVFDRPYVGDLWDLTLEQAKQNLQHLIEKSDERENLVISFFKKFSIDIDPSSKKKYISNIVEIEKLILKNIPKMKRIEQDLLVFSGVPSYANEFIAFSLLQDIAILTFKAMKFEYGNSIHWALANDFLSDDDARAEGIILEDAAGKNSIVVRGIKSKEYGNEAAENLEQLFFNIIPSIATTQEQAILYSLSDSVSDLLNDYLPS